MNKLLISLGMVALLAGCDNADKGKELQPQVEKQSSTMSVTSGSATSEPVKNQQTSQPEAMAPSSSPSPSTTTTAPTQSGNSEAVKQAADVLVIDASSEQAMIESLDKMIANLSEAEKEEFAEAFLMYSMSTVDMSLDEATNQKNMLKALNGKTIEDIFAAAAALQTQGTKTDNK